MEMRDTLIEQASRLVRRSGYAGFSYADLSEVVGIRKASIHHHFPTKADLGLGVVEAYCDAFGGELVRIFEKHTSAVERLAAYAELYRAGFKAGSGCLCGVLAAEFALLPKVVQRAVTRFFDDNAEWLESVLAAGRLRGEIGGKVSGNAGGDVSNAQHARMFLSTLQGAMLMARAQGDVATFDDAVVAALAAIRQ